MIVQVVQQFDVGVNKTKGQSPIGLNPNGIKPFAVAMQAVGSPRGALQVFTQSFLMYGRNTCIAARVKEGFEAFMFKPMITKCKS